MLMELMIRKIVYRTFYIVLSGSLLFILISFLFIPRLHAKNSETIAVLPFKVYALKPLNHLAFELQKALTASMAQKGYSTVNPEMINERLLPELALDDLELVRKIGTENKIDWLIKGSLSKVGENISVDFQVIPIAINKKPSSYYFVGDSIDELDKVIEKAALSISNKIRGLVEIGSISIKGNKRIEADAILASIESQEGGVFSPEQLDKDLKSIYKMGFFEDVQIDVEEHHKGKNVIFRVIEKPSIKRISFKGNKKIENKDLMDVLGIKKYTILNIEEIKNSIERLRDFYNQKGYFNVVINYMLEELSGNEIALVYQIKEGDKVTIAKIIFVGNVNFSDDDLKDVMDTDEKGFFSFITDSGHLDKKALESDIFKIKSFYNNNGYIKAMVGEPNISFKEDEGIVITIKINEGPQYAIGDVRIEGDLIQDAAELYKNLRISEERVYNRETVRADALKLSEIYSDEGYAFVDVLPQINEDDKSHKVDIVYQINKGKKVKFERIIITGNDKTRDKVIRRELKISEGGYFSGEKLKRSSQNLHRLGFFEEVEINTKQGTTAEDMILNIHVKEAPTGRLAMGAGYSSAENFIGMLEISQDNLFGRGQSLSARASLSSKSGRYTLSFTEPWLFDKPLSGGIDLYNWRYEYDEYTKDSRGGKLKLGFPLVLEFTRGSVMYTFDDADISEIEDRASQIIKDMEGRSVTSSLSVGVSRDSRNKRFNATRGSTNSFSIEYAGGVLGGDNYFTKYRAKSAWFFPAFWDTAISLQGRWGYVEKRSGGKLPVYEKFRLGGMNTVRGFEYASISPIDPDSGDRIGGEKMMVYNLEYRFPLVKEQGVMGVLFFDAGNVYEKDEDYSFRDLRTSIGAGIRWYSPMGPLRLEWGYNLDPQYDEPSSNWSFSIGSPF